jgi:hypothetical protein
MIYSFHNWKAEPLTLLTRFIGVILGARLALARHPFIYAPHVQSVP